MRVLHYIAFILLVIGGLNWGLVGLFSLDLVAAILGPGSPAARVVYVLVGLSAIVVLFTHFSVRNTTATTERPGSTTLR